MLRSFFALVLFLFLSLPSLFSKSIPLSEALAEGMVELEVISEGGHTGKSLKLRVRNLQRKKWTLQVPAGFIFEAPDSSIQDLINIQTRVLALDKQQSRTTYLYGMCIEAHNSSPAAERPYRAGGMAEGKLLQLAGYLHKHRIRDYAAQDAIWAVTNGHDVSYIGNPDLQRFTAQLLGRRLPGYTVEHGRRVAVPEQGPAFVPDPVVVRGAFRFQAEDALSATFGLYNEQGERLLTLFEAQDRPAGQHRFKFYFEVDELPPGRYFARLTDAQGRTVEELEVKF